MAVEYEIRHAMPGRVRLSVPAVRQFEEAPAAITYLLGQQEGVTSVRVNQSCAAVVIEYDPQRPELLSRIETALSGMSLPPPISLYQARRVDPEATPPNDSATPPADSETQTNLRPLALPTASLALSLFGGPLGAALALPLVGYNALPILKRAFDVLRNERRLNVDFLDSLAITISALQGNLFTSAFMTWLISLGDYIRDLTADKSKRAVAELLDYQGRRAWVLRDGVKIEVAVTEIAAGETVIVYPGGMIPVDGEVRRGRATVDQKTITGESLPVERGVGDKVYAAAVVREGKLYLRAERVGRETVAAQIVRLVETAPVGETRIQNYAEKFADRLVAPTLGVAGALFAVSADVNRLLSMVIVDYGTGIRVAAPTAVLASMTHGARQGIIIKSGSHIEKLERVDTIVFDKTGTLTQGVPQVMEITSYHQRRFPPDDILALAAAAEARLKHPVAQAILAKAREAGVRIPEREESHYHIGRGVEAQVNGYKVLVGSERFMRERQVQLNGAGADLKAINEKGCAALLLAVDEEVVGLIPYADRLRPETPAVIRTLRNRGVRDIVMLTGDNHTIARAVTARLGLDRFFSDVLPAEKAEIVRQLQQEGRIVAMVGDGINDSPALAHADVGIAMKNGADVAREAADVVLMEENLWKLISAIDLSQDAIKLIKQNYAIIAGLNTLALALAIPSGMISPGLTALLSNGSAILAGVNAVRPILRY
jgi:Cu2+-exporting ATPase